jgi:synaptobrevin family protein YKT6
MIYRGLIATCITSEAHCPNNIRLFLNEALSIFTREYEQNLYNKVVKDQCFEVAELKELLITYQKKEQIYCTLDETRDILVKNIEDLLQRGTDLDELIEKSNDLSNSSKIFAKKAKGLNCCNLF